MDISKERSILRVASCPGDSRRPMGFVSIRDQAGFFGAFAVPLRVLTIGRAGARALGQGWLVATSGLTKEEG